MIKCSFPRNPYLCFITFENKIKSVQSKGYLFSDLNTIISDFSSCDCTLLGKNLYEKGGNILFSVKWKHLSNLLYKE